MLLIGRRRRRVDCVLISESSPGIIVVVVGAVFVDGAIRALPRAAARAQSSAEALVLAIAAILALCCLSRLAGASAFWWRCCRTTAACFHALNSFFTALFWPKTPGLILSSALLGASAEKIKLAGAFCAQSASGVRQPTAHYFCSASARSAEIGLSA